jgi:DNA/RNA endonuclease YhcR with UshA esterase domain
VNLHVSRKRPNLLAVLGLVWLVGVACASERPLVLVKDVQPGSGASRVRLKGIVASMPSYDPDTGRLVFPIEDGSGQALVVAERSVSQALFESGRMPTIGDRVDVVGKVRILDKGRAENRVSLALEAPEQLAIERQSPAELTVAEVVRETESDFYRTVQIRGEVREVLQPYKALTILRVRDQTGEIDVVYDQDLVHLDGVPPALFAGDAVSARGVVVSHNGEPQIVLDRASGLVRLAPGLGDEPAVPSPSPTAVLAWTAVSPTVRAMAETGGLPEGTATKALAVPTRAPTRTATATREDLGQAAADLHELDLIETGAISDALLGQTVTVEARIERATLLSAGAKFVFDDGSGSAAVWMPDDLYKGLVDTAGWNVGAVGRVTGRVSEYEGELEIVPARVRDVVMVLRAPQIAVADARISSLSASDVGRRVTVEATIVAVNPFSAGVKYVLDDGGSQITLLLWQNVLGAIPEGEALAAGVRVRSSGWIQAYQGELEVVPGLAHDILFLAEPDGP